MAELLQKKALQNGGDFSPQDTFEVLQPIAQGTKAFGLDPENFNREVFLWNIDDNNGRIQITLDDLDQENPHVLDNGVTWIEIDENGDSELVIYSLEKTFEEYSSVVLQSAILMLIPLLLVLSHQVAIERRIRN